MKAQIKPIDGTLLAVLESHDKNWMGLWNENANTEEQSFSKNSTGSPSETDYLTVSLRGTGHTKAGDIETLHVYDGHEPNEPTLEAADIGEGSHVRGSILHENDKDLYSFVADHECCCG